MSETVYTEPQQEQLVAPRPTRRVPGSVRQIFKNPKMVLLLVAALAVAAGVLIFSKSQPSQPAVLGGSARSLDISADGKRLLIGLNDGSLRWVDIASGKDIASTRLAAPIMTVAAGPNGSALALAQGDANLHIFSADFASHDQRPLHPNAHDVIWSAPLDAAVVLSGGDDDLHAKLEFFPAQPFGLAHSTSQLYELKTWMQPRHLAAGRDGSRLAITFNSSRKINVVFFDGSGRRVAASALVDGVPEGAAVAADSTRAWFASAETQSVTEVGSRSVETTFFPKDASTSPPHMLVVNESTRRAYTAGSLTLPEIDLYQRRIVRMVELPERAAAIALSPDATTAYVTFDNRNSFGVIDLREMKLREVALREIKPAAR